jgi:hypothetical protein
MVTLGPGDGQSHLPSHGAPRLRLNIHITAKQAHSNIEGLE